METEELKNKIICGDNVEILGKLPATCVDLVLCSPPYDDLREYTGYSFDFENVARQLFRVVKPGGVVAWVVNDATIGGNRTGTSFRQALYFKEIGFFLHDVIIIQKSGTSFPSSGRYTACYEFMHILSKGKPKTMNLIKDSVKKWAGSWGKTRQRQADGSLRESTAKNTGAGKSGKDETGKYGYKARTNIWPVITGKGFAHFDGDLAYAHPATFATTLAIDVVRSWSNPGDIVCDPFVGSGTTCVAAKMLGRFYFGVDVSEKYCRLAEKRLAVAGTTVPEGK